MSVPPHLRASGPLLPRAIQISSGERVGIYDCLYVALAEQEHCEMVSADDRLTKNLQPKFPFIKHLSIFPGAAQSIP